MKKTLIAVFVGLFLQMRFALALTFNITYDSSVLASTNATQITNAFAFATQSFSDAFTNSATIKITVYWGPTGPFTNGISLGQSQFPLTDSSYSEITNALRAHRASAADTNSVASLPATDPTPSKNWLVAFAEARVLGLLPLSDPTEDGEIGFATNVSYTFDPNNRSVTGKYDFIGVAQHELSEVMGRDFYDLTTYFVPNDLFRFTNSAARNFNPDATNVYFSVDNGFTVLKLFYTNQFLGDIQDWKSSAVPDSFNALSGSGHVNPMGTADFIAMDVLGYNSPGTNWPSRLFATKTNGNFQLRFVNSPGVTFTVLGTTNIAAKETTWTALGTATESPAGQFTFTDTTATNGVRFYSVRGP